MLANSSGHPFSARRWRAVLALGSVAPVGGSLSCLGEVFNQGDAQMKQTWISYGFLFVEGSIKAILCWDGT